MLLTAQAKDVKFEFTVDGKIISTDFVGRSKAAVPLLGKPDMMFSTSQCDVVLDWKVNGFCGKQTTSPKPGYLKIRPGGQSHRDAVEGKHHNIDISISHPLDVIDDSWALQLSVYSWLCDCAVGSDFIVAVDQLVGDGSGAAIGRVAEFRGLISASYQWKLFDEIVEIWSIVNSDHIFRDLSLEDSKAFCERLDNSCQEFAIDTSCRAQWFREHCSTFRK